MDQAKKYLKIVPTLLWTLIVGLLEWILPESLCAKDVSEDIVLITGGGSGLGRAMAVEYAKLGSSLVLWDIDERGLKESKDLVEVEYGKLTASKKICRIYRVDVSDKDEVKKYAEQVYIDLNNDKSEADQPVTRYVSVLVNNAGIFHNLMLHELRDDQIEKIFKINILAHFWTVRAFLPNMIKHKKGHIVEIASMAGHAGLGRSVDYCSTKHAVVGFEEALCVELDEMGLRDKIRTTVVSPLWFKSNLYIVSDLSNREKQSAKYLAMMTTQSVAGEAVRAMRCNHSRVLVPKLKCYFLNFLKPYLTRDSILTIGRALNFAEDLKHTKGTAALKN